MCINDKKGKNCEDYVELMILYLIWVIGAAYYQGDTLGELVKYKISTIYHTNKNSCQVRHIWSYSRIPKTQAGHVRPLSLIQLTSRVPETLAEHILIISLRFILSSLLIVSLSGPTHIVLPLDIFFPLCEVSGDRTYTASKPNISGLARTYLIWGQTYPALQF
jgi:hypothetical protein